ncbi:hypothetical protein GCM10007940_07360 [Portibacter lacus]|uniref:Secretion system C-terminal sorting domain-containing protein n=1 Tax=Portibacter lacus TaxID=1099794 RepID=A0AA37WC53_9BACT|nr:hypothetical protein GCM10007940_07360 [Portibacter lacus]
MLILPIAHSQEKIKVENIEVTSTKVIKLGHSEPIRELQKRARTSPIKRRLNKRNKQVPDNFKGRRDRSKAVHLNIEHLGNDPLRQKETSAESTKSRILHNFNGIGDFGSPHDPSGDVSDRYYVQMINATYIGVYNLDGALISEFSANTLWFEFSQNSAGDPIVLYDETADRWILTEFSNPSNILIAISDNGDPLGSYSAYNFSTPNFPDYPKYGLSPEFLTFTSNEEGSGQLHNYFIDLKALYAGDNEVNMQRIRVNGNNSTEAGFFVTTPVDWNGRTAPYDNKPITILLNDSSWSGGPAQDQIEVFSFDIDFSNEGNTEVTKTVIPTTPFDSYPCAESGFGFACIPQKDGPGLDGVPETIMNVPHLRNFGTHESMVFAFITDATNGDNISGIRWMELRRTGADSEWALYQEGTFAPDDELHRFLPSIAIDAKGSIGLAYNISSPDIYVGARYTGRNAADPLGRMTLEEVTIVDGLDVIYSGERFGDYSQMSVSPNHDDTFWWTSEYAGEGRQVTQTRIVAFQIRQDSFDLTVKSIDNPITSSELSSEEKISATILNSGLKQVSNFEVDLLLDDAIIESIVVDQNIGPNDFFQVNFSSLIDMSLKANYDFEVIVRSDFDENLANDTLKTVIRNLHELEIDIKGHIQQGNCTDTTQTSISILNDGAQTIDSLTFEVLVNEVVWDTFRLKETIKFGERKNVIYKSIDLPNGFNTIDFSLLSINESPSDGIPENNNLRLSAEQLPQDHFITINFTTDKFPEESGWNLYSQNSGELIASGILELLETTISTNACVNPDSCFTFIATDTYGDGICCNYGSGNFNITDNEGLIIVANNGNFGPQAEISFCARGTVCSLTYSTDITDATSESAADGIILINVDNGIAPYQYSIDGGKNFQTDAVFSALSSGDYDIVVKDASGICELMETVAVRFTSQVLDYYGNEVIIDINPNPTSDLIKINISSQDLLEPMIEVQILDLTGQILQQRKINKYSGVYTGTFSMMAYPAGTYLIRVDQTSFNYMQKVIKLN